MTKYTLRQAQKPELPTINVLESEGGVLVATFGSTTYKTNVSNMRGPYFNSSSHPNLTFRPATTARSIDVLASDVPKFKKQILNPKWLQAGRIGRASEGVYVNLPLDENGEPIIDERVLKSYLNGVKKENGIYVVENGKVEGVNDFSFAPYGSFKTDVQETGDFVEGGLARALEHTSEKVAPNLVILAKTYSLGVNVWGFEPVKKGEVLPRVASLDSNRNLDDDRLVVDGSDWYDYSDGGFAFGVSGEHFDRSANKTKK